MCSAYYTIYSGYNCQNCIYNLIIPINSVGYRNKMESEVCIFSTIYFTTLKYTLHHTKAYIPIFTSYYLFPT